MSNYYISKYIVESNTKDGDCLLFSTISKAVIQLEPAEYSALKARKFDLLAADTICALAASAIITEDENEAEVLRERFIKSQRSPKTFSTYISFSPDCNFKCVYCYQGEKSLSIKMTPAIIDSVCNWYKRKIAQGCYSKVLVTLFGGEPLLSLDLIKRFDNSLKAVCLKLKVELKYKIVTNGYLLSQDIVNYLKCIGVEELQITLDGARDIHNSRRPLASGGGTYEKILNNIASLENYGINFVIRISFDKSNLGTIIHLIEDLKYNGISHSTIYFSPIHQTIEQISQKESFCSKCVFTDSYELIDAYKELYSMLVNYGYEIPTYYSNGPCMVNYSDSCLITHTGELYKCVEMVGDNSLCIGSVAEDSYNHLYNTFLECSPSKECFIENCKFIPICAGGCTMQAYLKTGNIQHRDCHKQIFNVLTPYLLSLKYGDYIDNVGVSNSTKETK